MITVNLELSKELAKAGYPQEGSFAWCYQLVDPEHYGEMRDWYLNHNNGEGFPGSETIISPTADEILEQLPQTTIEYGRGWYGVLSKGHDDGDEESLANALAKIWLYLKENNLLSQKEKEG